MFRKNIFALLFFFLFTVQCHAANFLLDRVVAIVNQDVITWSELYRTMEMDANPNVKAMSEDERRRIFKENEATFLETMINYKLQVQEAVALGLRVTEDELKDAIEGIKKKYSMTDAQFQESLRSEGYTMEDYRKRLYEQIIVSKIINQQIRSKILLTDQDIEKFIRENREFSGDTESYRIRMVFLRKQKSDDANMKSEERAKEIYDRAIKGESFSDLARQYSEDATRENGGDLGFVDRSNLAKEFSTALAAMKQGDISKPFRTDAGLYIIRLEEKSSVKSPAETKEEAKRQLASKIFNDKYAFWVKSLREKSFIEVRL